MKKNEIEIKLVLRHESEGHAVLFLVKEDGTSRAVGMVSPTTGPGGREGVGVVTWDHGAVAMAVGRAAYQLRRQVDEPEEDDFWVNLRKRYPAAPLDAWKRVVRVVQVCRYYGATREVIHQEALDRFSDDEVGTILAEMEVAGLIDADQSGLWRCEGTVPGVGS